MRLRTGTGEKTEVKVRIDNVSVSHVFIITEIVVEVIIGTDFMLAHDINLKMGQHIMSWGNVKIPPDVGYKHQTHAKRIVAIEQERL